MRHYAIEAPEHILLEEIAADLGTPVSDGRLDGAVARLVRVGNRGRIRVSDAEGNLGRRRFSIAHELGHFVLGHADSGWVRCLEHELHDFGGTSRVETEANYFASEFLLPESLVRPRCDVRKVDLKCVRAIAEDFGTSVTSTAMRFVDFCPEMCAVVFSQNNRVAWFVKSPSCWPWLRARGDELDPWCGAACYFKKGTVAARPQKMDGASWLEDKGAERYDEVVEHSMAIPSIDAVLTMLWIPES